MLKNNKLIKKAQKEYEYLVGDERIQRLAELEERARLEIDTAKEIGYNEGEKKANINIAKSLLRKGISITIIAEATSLSIDEIKELKKKFNKEIELV